MFAAAIADKPYVTMKPEFNPLKLEAGNSETLRCESDANPDVTSRMWFKNGNTLNEISEVCKFVFWCIVYILLAHLTYAWMTDDILSSVILFRFN